MDKGVEGLENWTIFMDIICVSSLTYFADIFQDFASINFARINFSSDVRGDWNNNYFITFILSQLFWHFLMAAPAFFNRDFQNNYWYEEIQLFFEDIFR